MPNGVGGKERGGKGQQLDGRLKAKEWHQMTTGKEKTGRVTGIEWTCAECTRLIYRDSKKAPGGASRRSERGFVGGIQSGWKSDRRRADEKGDVRYSWRREKIGVRRGGDRKASQGRGRSTLR